MLVNTTIEKVNGYTDGTGQGISIGGAVINTERIIYSESLEAGAKTRILYNLKGTDRREDSILIDTTTSVADLATAQGRVRGTFYYKNIDVTHYDNEADVFSGDTVTRTRAVDEFVIATAKGAADSYQVWGEGAFKNKELKVNQTLAALITAVTI